MVSFRFQFKNKLSSLTNYIEVTQGSQQSIEEVTILKDGIHMLSNKNLLFLFLVIFSFGAVVRSSGLFCNYKSATAER